MFGILKKIVSPFTRWKSALGQKIRSLFSKTPDESAFSSLEQLFYEADLGRQMSSELVDQLRIHARKNPDPESVTPFLKTELLKLFPKTNPVPLASPPHVILVVGVNGSGKTTSLAKLAAHYQKEGKTVLIAAADTFRAAAIEQLQTWAERVGVSIVKSKPHGDPAAVAFDALSAAKARGIDVVLIDTAGRLQTKSELMDELTKLRKVCQKLLPEAPNETLLVIDATVGQNGLDQARTFHAHTPITGIVLTKLDGSAKGGIAVAIQKELNLPIVWIGLGETADDLTRFDPVQYVDALLS